MNISMTGFLSVFMFFWLSPNVHDLHISTTEIRYKPDQKTIQFSVKVFLDDIENALRLYEFDDLYLCSEKESPEAEEVLAHYIQRKLQIKIDQKTYTPNFIGKELSDDMSAVWCYLEILEVQTFSSIEIENQLLHDLFDDQNNIMAYYKDQKNIVYKSYDNKEAILALDNQ